MNNELSDGSEYGSLKTLTVLTFIGSGLGVISSVYNYFTGAKGLAKLEEMRNAPNYEQLPDFVKKMSDDNAINLLRAIEANKLPIFFINTLGCLLCIYGAIEMRKLKMTGFYTYCLGSILPQVGMVLFVGMGFFSGYASYFGIVISLVFMLLYFFNRKHLVAE